MCSTNFYQMDDIITYLNDLIDNYKSDISQENFKRYKAFINKLSYSSGDNSIEGTVYENVKKLTIDSPDNLPKKFTFVLGAGVSADFRIPNWEELIFRINFSKYWQHMYGESENPPKLYVAENRENRDKTRENLKNGLFRLNSNLYEWAQYAENNYNQDEELKERIHCMERPSGVKVKNLDNTLYSVVKDALYFVASVNIKTEKTSLDYICEIAKKKKVDRIITYNYDDCLEYCWDRTDVTNASSKAIKCFPIFDKQQLYERNIDRQGISEIYHVHGFIPHFSEFTDDKSRFGEIEKAFNSYDGKKLILSEISYDDMQEEIYKWRNDIQVDTLLRYSCIFIGFSATDVNFKRIVKQLSKTAAKRNERESPDHFITICIDDYIKNFYCGDERIKDTADFLNILKGEDDKRKQLYPYIISAIEMMIDRRDYLVRYGIYPLFTTIEDLPKLLCKI